MNAPKDRIEFKGKWWYFDTIAPLTGDAIYQHTDTKTGLKSHVLLVKN